MNEEKLKLALDVLFDNEWMMSDEDITLLSGWSPDPYKPLPYSFQFKDEAKEVLFEALLAKRGDEE